MYWRRLHLMLSRKQRKREREEVMETRYVNKVTSPVTYVFQLGPAS
jgi:hypothetical protein